MKGSAQFLLELLIEEPKHHWLVTPFSMSPEHGYYDSDGKLAFLSPAPTMDVAIIRELFPHCIAASKLLGVDEEFRGKLEAALTKLPPYQINQLGYLQEWIEDWRPGDQGHNCLAQLHLLSRQLDHAARQSASWRPPSRSGWKPVAAGGGWPTAWDISVWARLERGEKVAE